MTDTTTTATAPCKSAHCSGLADPNMASTDLEGYCENCQADIQNARDIESLVGQLDGQVKDAETAVRKAAHALSRLRGDDVYDVELAESLLGDDATAELEEITRKLRNVARIVEIRQRMLKENA